jgi:hypothetical protein
MLKPRIGAISEFRFPLVTQPTFSTVGGDAGSGENAAALTAVRSEPLPDTLASENLAAAFILKKFASRKHPDYE